MCMGNDFGKYGLLNAEYSVNPVILVNNIRTIYQEYITQALGDGPPLRFQNW
jgi:hypothetical protein